MDKSSPLDVVKEIAAAIPGASYAEIEGAPHMLFRERPRETAHVLGGFLRETLKSRAHRR